jgi:hypothetical protein
MQVTIRVLTVIPDFHHDVDELCALLGYYAASVNNYHTTPRNIPKIALIYVFGK